MGTKEETLGWYHQLNCSWCSNICSCFTDSPFGAGFMLHWPILSPYTPPTCDSSLVLPRLLWPCYFQKVLVRHLSGICSEFVLFPHNQISLCIFESTATEVMGGSQSITPGATKRQYLIPDDDLVKVGAVRSLHYEVTIFTFIISKYLGRHFELNIFFFSCLSVPLTFSGASSLEQLLLWGSNGDLLFPLFLPHLLLGSLSRRVVPSSPLIYSDQYGLVDIYALGCNPTLLLSPGPFIGVWYSDDKIWTVGCSWLLGSHS